MTVSTHVHTLHNMNHINLFLYSSHLITDIQQISSASCICAVRNQTRTHFESENKRTDKSLTLFSCSDCHCQLSSIQHKSSKARRSPSSIIHSHHKKNLWYHLQHMDKFSYLYTLLCIFCIVTSSASADDIVVEDQQTQVGHFFFYNISTNGLPLKSRSQLKVCIRH